MSAFADASFLVSFYVPDSNGGEAASRMSRLEIPVLLSSLGELELANALRLHVFRKELADSEIQLAETAFRRDLESGLLSIKPFTDAMFAEALKLSTQWTAKLGARSLDVLQVAAAKVLEAETFLTFDDRQKKLAKAAGLKAS